MDCVRVPTAGERREEYAQLNGGGGEGQEGLNSDGERGICSTCAQLDRHEMRRSCCQRC